MAASAALLLVACSDMPLFNGAPAQEPTRLEIRVHGDDLRTGDTVPVSWTVLDRAGRPIEPLPPWAVPQWQDPTGLVTLSGKRLAVTGSGGTRLTLTLAGLQSSADLRINPAQLNVEVAAYITQVVQRLDGSIPLVAGRDGVLRVFVRGDAPNFFRPRVRATITSNGQVHTFEVAAEDEGVPVQIDEGAFARSWNITIPPILAPGATLLVEVLPDAPMRAGPNSALTYPADGQAQVLDVRDVTTFPITFVPIHIIGLATGDVTPANVESYMAATRQVWPLSSVSVQVRAPYSTTTRSATADDWSDLLREIRTLRILDGSTRYYHGILRREGAWSGLAYVGYPVGITRDGNSTWTVAHELGHNFGRRHAPCGNPSGVDASFPQPDGSIGLWG